MSSKQNIPLSASLVRLFLEQEPSVIEKIMVFLRPFRGQKDLIRALLSCIGQNSDLSYNIVLDGLFWQCDVMRNISPGTWISFVPEADDFLAPASPFYLYLLVASETPVSVILSDLANKEEKTALTPLPFRTNRYLYLLPKIEVDHGQPYLAVEITSGLKGMFYLLRTTEVQ